MARRKGRILAFQALFSWDVGGSSVDELLLFPWIEEETLTKTDAGSLTFARLLIAGTIEHVAEIDSLIKNHLDSWDFERVNKVDLAVLRISVYPLIYQHDIHPSIVIDEAIDIAKEFGSGDSFRFINAVLDNIRKEVSK